jgi:hypothetical protein
MTVYVYSYFIIDGEGRESYPMLRSSTGFQVDNFKWVGRAQSRRWKSKYVTLSWIRACMYVDMRN